MTIYKVRFYINSKAKRYDGDEQIIIDNLDTAKCKYLVYLDRCKFYANYDGYTGGCGLFIPHIFEDGSLAYWADEGNYIEQFEFE